MQAFTVQAEKPVLDSCALERRMNSWLDSLKSALRLTEFVVTTSFVQGNRSVFGLRGSEVLACLFHFQVDCSVDCCRN